MGLTLLAIFAVNSAAWEDTTTCLEFKPGLKRVVKDANCVCDDGLYESQIGLSC